MAVVVMKTAGRKTHSARHKNVMTAQAPTPPIAIAASAAVAPSKKYSIAPGARDKVSRSAQHFEDHRFRKSLAPACGHRGCEHKKTGEQSESAGRACGGGDIGHETGDRFNHFAHLR